MSRAPLRASKFLATVGPVVSLMAAGASEQPACHPGDYGQPNAVVRSARVRPWFRFLLE
jgi:hypothetical protein